MPKLRVGVVYGGRSGEHEVSLMSARSIISALDPEKYEVTAIGITKSGQWVKRPIPDEAEVLDFTIDNPEDTVEIKPDPTLWQGFDVIFPVLHGTYGEDGTIQGLFEMANIPYVGAGVAASAVSMDKALMRVLFSQAGLPLVPWVVVSATNLTKSPKLCMIVLWNSLAFPVLLSRQI